MTGSLLTNLTWLPRPPTDFNARCQALAELGVGLGLALQGLASFALDENQLNRLARSIGRAVSQNRSLAPLVPFRLGIVSNATTHFVVPALVATAARYGIALECVEAEYGMTMQEALASDSMINTARADAVLIALDYRGLPLQATPGDPEATEQSITASVQYLAAIRSGFRDHGRAPCILQTIPQPIETIFGSLDFAVPGTMRSTIHRVNRTLADSVSGTEDLLVDVAGLAEAVGLADWHDPTLWNMAKLPFASTFLPLYAEYICRVIAAMRGRSRRCLVMDLDNTLWSGVIGDDGLEGIVLGQGNPTGEAFLELQRSVLMLRNRGVVLAVSSKNNDDTARRPFRDHSEMLIKEHHIAVFQANWNDKATNIKAIA